jgi:polyisoprenyl-phosphate glycosyltransferase
MHSPSTDPEPTSGLRPAYSIVVPIYRNEETIVPLLERLRELAESLETPPEVVFVVDGSPDGSWLLLRRLLRDSTLRAQLLAHSRNFGSFAAIRTGLSAAHGRFVAVMAADLQEPPELVLAFFEALHSGEYDVAVGRRTGRSDPFLSSLVARMVWRLLRRIVHKEIPSGGVDIFACTSEVADELVALRESHSSLVGLLYWLGFRRIEVPYHRLPRSGGQSGWTVGRRTRYLLDSVFSFTNIPILLLTTIGLVGAFVTATAAIVILIARLTGQITVAGYTPVILALLLSTFTLLFAIGIVGAYVWRTYENSKGRPPSVVMSHELFGGERRD